MASKITSKPQQPSTPPSGFYFKLHFWNQWLPLIEISYRLSYLENFYFSNFQHPASEAANKFLSLKLQHRTDVMLASIAVCCGIRNHTGLLIMVERQSHFGCTNCVVLGPSCDFFLFFLWCIADILIWTWPQWSQMPFEVANIFLDIETTFIMRTKVGLIPS